MKKLVLLILLLGVFAFTGCSVGNKTLSCSTAKTLSGLPYTEGHELHFNGNIVDQYIMKLKFDLSSYASNPTTFNTMVESLRSEYSKAIEPGVMTSVYPEGNYVYAIFTITMSNFDGYLNYTGNDLTKFKNNLYSPSKTKDNFENTGYTCTLN